MDKKAFNPTEYKNKFAAAKYDRVALLVKKGKRDELHAIAKAKGFDGLNAYIKDLLQKDTGIDL